MYAFSPALKAAAEDYRFLLDKGYPENSSLRLTGDRYRLSRDERMMLFRGVAASDRSAARRAKLAEGPLPGELHVDGYNVLFTILNYLEGRRLFIACDGFLRDSGSLHGRIGNKALFGTVIADFPAFLAARGLGKVFFYLDAPVSHSAEHAAALREGLEAAGLAGDCELFASADYGLKRAGPSCASTSDTAIIDALECSFYDCARDFLDTRYAAEFPSFLF